MAKKRKNPFFENPVDNEQIGNTELDDLLGSFDAGIGALIPFIHNLPHEEATMALTVLIDFIDKGLTPESFNAFYDLYQMMKPYMKKGEAKTKAASKKKGAKGKNEKIDVPDVTLLLKIQMKGVTNPPMWREVEVPADFTFEKLHDVIQDVVGLGDYHLWQFSDSVYDDSDLVIGIPMGESEYDMGLEYVSDNAYETPIYKYLREEGDKLEYLYDFGDDWLFTVTVKKVLDKKTEHPVCTAFKSRLNAMEDTGGPWRYKEMREYYENWDKYTKKEQKQIAKDLYYDSASDFFETMVDNSIDLDDVNELMQYI